MVTGRLSRHWYTVFFHDCLSGGGKFLSNVVIFQVKQAVSLFLCSSYTKTEQSVDPLMEVACNSSTKQLSHQQFEHQLKHDACSAGLYYTTQMLR